MSTTVTLTKDTVVKGTDTQARIFLVGVDPDKAAESAAPGEPVVFILNSQDFIDLQKYVKACTALPTTTSLFEVEYPKAGMSRFLKEDPELYDIMKNHLPAMHQRCAAFQTDTLEPMIVLGGRISNFANDAGTYIDRVVVNLNKMGEPSVKRSSPEYKTAHRVVDRSLKKMISHAGEVGAQCGQVLERLVAFKAETVKDKVKLDEICTRLRKIIPADAKSQLQKVIDDTRLAYQTVKDLLDRKSREARVQGEKLWFHYIPVFGRAFTLPARLKAKGVLNEMNGLNKTFESMKKQSEDQIDQLTATVHQFDALSTELQCVESTIVNAMEAVEKMKTTFTELQTQFTEIEQKLTYVNSDIDDEYINEYVVQIGGLQNAAKIWRRVGELSAIFQNTGLVLDIKQYPAETIEGVD